MKRTILIWIIICCLTFCVSACQKGGVSSAENGDKAGTGTVSQEESQRPASEAAEIFLMTEGETAVTDKNGIALPQTEGMRLYNGSRVVTADSGSARIGLGEDVLKLDRLSAAEVSRKGSNVVLLKTGRLFFDIASADRRLTIRTAPARVIVTEEASGYVEADGSSRTRLCVLSGSLVFGGYEPVTGTKKSVMVSAGQTALCELFLDGSDRVAITISDFESEDVAVFAAEEVAGSESLKERIDSAGSVLNASAIVEGIQERRREEEAVLVSRVENAGRRQANWEKEDTGASDEMFRHTSVATGGDGTAVDHRAVILAPVPGLTGQGVGNVGNTGNGIVYLYQSNGQGENGSKGSSSAKKPAVVERIAYKDIFIKTSKVVDIGEYGEDVGDVTVEAGVGDGTVTLKGIHIHGNLLIQGGGSDSVELDGCVLNGTIIVEKSSGNPVHLELLGGTRAPALTVAKENTGTATVNIQGGSSLEFVNAESDVKITTSGDVKEPKVTLAMAEKEKIPMVWVNGNPVTITASGEPSEGTGGHQFEKVEEVPSTCKKQGYTKYTCKGCDICEAAGENFSYMDIEPFAEHSYPEKGKYVPATSYMKKGYTQFYCSVCYYGYRVYDEDFADSSSNND